LNESSGSNNVGYGYLAVGAESGVVTVFKGDLRSKYRGVGIDRYDDDDDDDVYSYK
jgi:hypothetical protein